MYVAVAELDVPGQPKFTITTIPLKKRLPL